MTEEQAREIIQYLKAGKRYESESSSTFTGDYWLYLLFYKKGVFYSETYSCHNDVGERLIRTTERDEQGAINYLKQNDYEEVLAQLRD